MQHTKPSNADAVSTGTNDSPGKTSVVVSWGAAVVIAGLLTVMGWLPKLTGDPISVALFDTIATASFIPESAAAPMRFGVAVSELAVVVLVLLPMTRVFGGALAALVMGGAMLTHIVTPLGLFPEVTVDGETMTLYPLVPVAVIIAILGVVLMYLHKDALPGAGR